MITERRKEAERQREIGLTERARRREGSSLRFMTIKLKSAVFELEMQLKWPKVLLTFSQVFCSRNYEYFIAYFC